MVGQHSLTSLDTGEKSYNILSYICHQSYDAVSKKNNIAMLEVHYFKMHFDNEIKKKNFASQLSGSITFGTSSKDIVHGDLPSTTVDGILIGWGGNNVSITN